MVANMAAPPQFQRKKKEARQKFSWNHKISGLVSGPVTLYIGTGSNIIDSIITRVLHVKFNRPSQWRIQYSAFSNKLNSSMRKQTVKAPRHLRPKVDPKVNQLSIRSQRDVSIGSNRAANQAANQEFLSTTLNRVAQISRKRNSWTTSKYQITVNVAEAW